MKVYTGRRTDSGTVVRVQEISEHGTVLFDRPLRHHVKHSPTGLEWGYGGSGPADLARSLLIDALGPKATCTTCDGGQVIVLDTDEPRIPDRDEWRRLKELQASGDPEGDILAKCWECDGGIRGNLPYQAFKFDVVGHLTRDEWRMPAANVLEWYEHHVGSLAT